MCIYETMNVVMYNGVQKAIYHYLEVIATYHTVFHLWLEAEMVVKTILTGTYAAA